MLYPFRFKPVFRDYLWGGRWLASIGPVPPGDGLLAERWDLSGHPQGVSVVANGELAGTSLPDLIRRYGRTVLGSKATSTDLERFPMLIKWIDARQPLSVQVHPDDAYAAEHEGGAAGKSEMWYVYHADPGARLIVGLKPGVSRERFAEAARRGDGLSLLREVDVRAGDAINIPAGTVHAIGAGLVICEIQQTSDLTYRVNDYGRTDAAGNQRLLHLDKALAVLDDRPQPEDPRIAGLIVDEGGLNRRVLLLNRYFSIEEWTVKTSCDGTCDGTRFQAWTVLAGSGRILYRDTGGAEAVDVLNPGDTLLLPACLGNWRLEGDLKLLAAQRSDPPADALNLLRAAAIPGLASEPAP